MLFEGLFNIPIIAFSMPGMGELLIILVIILVLFGGSKIPEIARSLGKGMKEFKKGIQDSSDNEKPPSKQENNDKA